MPASKKEAKEFVKRWKKRLGAIPAGSNNEQQDMDSVARNHLARLRRGGEPLRGRSRRRAKRKGRDACCVPAPRAQSSRPF